MIRALRRKLAESYPGHFCSAAFLPYALISGAFVFLFFLFIQPFGLWAYASVLTNPLYAGYGLITALLVSLNHLIVPRLLRRTCGEERWNVGRQVLMSTWIILTIALACYFFTQAYSDGRGLNLNKVSFFLVLFTTFFIGGLLSLLFILVNQNRALRRNQRLESEANTLLDARPVSAAASDDKSEVVLVAENGRDIFKTRLADLLFIAAEENYVEIHFKKEKVQRLLLRSSLKRIEEQVATFQPRLFRCHRAFIVNVGQIQKVTGNAQGFRLTLHDCPVTVPVARSYIKEFRRALAQPS